MKDEVNKLYEKIKKKRIFSANYFDECDIDDLLDLRDEECFDSEWMRVYDDLNDVSLEDKENKLLNSIREKSFVMAYDLTGSSDLAGCVSDDFELIVKAYFADYRDAWLDALIAAYERGEFPCGELKM